MLAIVNRNQDLARQLVEAPRVDIVRRDRDGMSGLHLAVSAGQLEVARALLRRNTASINGKERRMGRTPIHFACALRCHRSGLVGSFRLPLPDGEGEEEEEEEGDEEEKEKEGEGEGEAGGSDEVYDNAAVVENLSRVAVAGSDPSPPPPPLPLARCSVGQSQSQSRSGSRSGSRSLAQVGSNDTDLPTDSVNDVYNENVPEDLSGDSAPSTYVDDDDDDDDNDGGNSEPPGQRRAANGHRGNSAAPKAAAPRARKKPREQAATRAGLTSTRHFSKDSSSRRGKRPVAGGSGGSGPERSTAVVPSDASARHPARHSIAGGQPGRVPPAASRQQAPLSAQPLKAKPYRATTAAVVVNGRRKSSRPATAPAAASSNPLRYQVGSTFSLSHPGYKIPSAPLPLGRDSPSSYRSRDSGAAAAPAAVAVTPANVGSIRYKLVALLLEHGADGNLMTMFRKAPVHITAMMGAADVMGLLLPHVTNPSTLSAANKTALHLAVEGGHLALVAQLVGAGAKLALRDISGLTALHQAARLGHADIAALLLRARADKNACDFRQMMPLHHACLEGHEHVVAVLLGARACTTRVDNAGFLPLDYRGWHRPGPGQRPEPGVEPAIQPEPSPSPSCTPVSTARSATAAASAAFAAATSTSGATITPGGATIEQDEEAWRLGGGERRRKTGNFFNIHGDGSDIRQALGRESQQHFPRTPREGGVEAGGGLCNGSATTVTVTAAAQAIV